MSGSRIVKGLPVGFADVPEQLGGTYQERRNHDFNGGVILAFDRTLVLDLDLIDLGQ